MYYYLWGSLQVAVKKKVLLDLINSLDQNEFDIIFKSVWQNDETKLLHKKEVILTK